MNSIFRQLADSSTSISISKDDLNLPDAPSALGGSQVETILMNIYIVAGIAAVIAIVIGGIRYTTSNGDSNNIASAKNTILYAVAGLVVIIAAAGITQFVIGNVGK